MASTISSSTLLSYYSAQTQAVAARASKSVSASSSSSTTASSKKSATANDVTPWTAAKESQEKQDAEVLSLTKFIDTSDVPLSAGTTTDSKTEQDNQKLFALYKAVNSLSYLATMAKRDGTTDGQREGYNTRFQAGLTEIQKYIASTSFNNFTLQAQAPATSVTSTAKVASATFSYVSATLANGTNIDQPLSGLTKSDTFTVSVTKDGTKQDIAIDLSKVDGDLTLTNIVTYANSQLKAAGVATRFKKDMTAGDIGATTAADKAKQTYSLEVDPGGSETVSMSAASTPSLYVSATTGLTTATTDSSVDNRGRLIKISDLSSGDPTADYARTMTATSGTNTASSTVTDASGNVYVLGTATGDLGSELNQGDQDTYLTKYDSAGNVIWQRMLGSTGTATATAMALNPNGGVTLVGSTTSALTSTALTNGKAESYAAQYDANGNQVWTAQIPTMNQNSATSVSVDTSGNVYIGGTTTNVIGSGQVNQGGNDAYLAKISSKGKILSESQFGTSGNDTVSATAVTSSGDLVVASVQNGRAILSKYTGGDTSQTAAWTYDMGDLGGGGSVSGLTVKDGKIYVSGTTSASSLNATTATGTSASGGTDAFLFTATDSGTSVDSSSAKLTYLGTSASDKGAALTVGSDGTVYVAGTTSGTFSGESRNGKDTSNMFVASVATNGSVNWIRQYGGKDGQSVGSGIAFSANGSSVLDALGLPSGQVQGKQDSSLTNATTLRAGDSFSMEIEGDAKRKFTITIDKGETMTSLVTKLNAQLGSKGKASVSYTSAGAALKIEVSSGVTAKLISGPTNSDALGRLGITAQTLYKASTTSSSSSTSSSTSSTDSTTYALGLASNVDLLSSTDSGVAHAEVSNILSSIQSIYQKTNSTSSSSSTSTSSTSSQTMSAAATAYSNKVSANSSVALSLLSA